MTGIYIMLGGMVLFATVIGVLDWLAERHDRHHRAHDTSA
jgi:hypothetical protein